MKLLVLYPYIPWPLDRGTYHRTYHLLRALATEHQVDLLCLTENGERMEHAPVFEQFCQKVRFAPIEHPPWAKLADRLLSRTPTSVQHWDTPAARSAVATMLAQGSYDAAYVCDIVMAQFFLDQHQDLPLIIDRSRVDLLFQSTQRRLMSKGFLNRLNDMEAVFKTWLFERRIAARARLQIICGPDDQTYIRQHISKTVPLHVLANGVDEDYFHPQATHTPAAEKPTVLFCGAMDYTPNIDALRWYFTDVHAALSQQVPGLQVLIVGKDPIPEIRAYAQLPGVTVTGSVPDVRPYYQSAWLQMVPLRIGGGTRLKIVESLAIGTPVVSTTIGAQGLDLQHGQDLLLADSPADFALQLARGLQDSALRQHLRQHGRSTVLQRLTWKSLGQQLLTTLRSALPSPTAADQPQTTQPKEQQHPICLLGIPFDHITLKGTLAHIQRAITQPQAQPQFIVTANVDFTLQCSTDSQLRRIMHQADLVVCDGQPLVWASKLLGNALPERVAGSDLVPVLLDVAEQQGQSVYFLGGAPSVLQRAIQRVQQRHPRLRIAGHHSPPYQPLEQMDHAGICAQIRAAKPDILLVSFGCPKQEKWIHQHYRQLGVPVSIGVGATIDFLAGAVARAPRWMQHTGLEWVWRLLQEPRRLLRRYARGLLYFCPAIARQILTHQLAQLQHRSSSSSGKAQLSSSGYLQLPSQLTARTAADFSPSSQAALQQQQQALHGIVLDAAPLRHIDSTGLALLSRFQRDSGSTTTLCQPPPRSLQRALQQHQLTDLLPTTRTEPLHVAISTSVIQRGKSGVAQYVLALVRAMCTELQPSQHRLSLFVLEEDMPLFSFTAGRVNLIPVAERYRSPVRNILWHQFQLPRLIQQHGIHVLHIPSYRRMVWQQCCTLITTIHDLAQFQVRGKYDLLRMAYGRIIARRLATRQHQIIAISENTAQDIQRYFHIPRSQQQVIHNGLDHQRFQPAPTADADAAAAAEPVFLYVSRIEHPAKNHIRLIDAFTQFKQSTGSHWQLHLAGSDWHGAAAVHQHAARSPVAADIHFLGFVPDAELPRLYHRAGAMVYPSLFEGFGLPPVEAMASGCPVISSPSGSLAEVVADAAHLIDPLDTHSIATALTRLATDSSYRQQLITAGLQNARRFNWQQNARHLLHLYTETAARQQQPHRLAPHSPPQLQPC